VTLHERIAALPPWSPPSPPGRAVVVAAHPDDETLALAGPVDALARNGWTLDLLVLTDGEAAFPRAGADVGERLARTRRRELVSAWTILTAGAAGAACTAVFAGLPDSGLHARTGEVRAAVDEVVAGADLVLGLWPGDPHPDHVTAGTATLEAAAAAGVPALVAPLWALAWWAGDDPRLPWDVALRCPLDAAAASRRQRALAAHASQVRGFAGYPPVVPAEALDVLLRRHAVVVPA
jgi:LmbE family N-acetylglucosaminyl deacetylase